MTSGRNRMALQLSLHASKVPTRGPLRQAPNPVATISICDQREGATLHLLGTTEVIRGTIKPSWTRVFLIDYDPAGTKKVNLCVTIYDQVKIDGGGNDRDRTEIGRAWFDVGDILSSRGCMRAKRIRGSGCVYACIEERNHDCEGGRIIFQLKAIGVKKERGTNTFAYEISRKGQRQIGATCNVVHRSGPASAIEGGCLWGEVSQDLATFCNGDLDRAIVVSVFSGKKIGKRKLVGSFETSVCTFVQASAMGSHNDTSKSFLLRNGEKEVGSVIVIRAALHLQPKRGSDMSITSKTPIASSPPTRKGSDLSSTSNTPMYPPPSAPDCLCRRPTFGEYIAAGCRLDFCVAIDFTSSNGDPRVPGSLHYNMDNSLNDYEEAIVGIGGLVSQYSATNSYPVWGFGAKYDGKVRHSFQCGASSTATGIDGILTAYRSVFETELIMSGPTVFLNVIQAAASRALSHHDPLRYTVLLILTDGNVSDIDATNRKLAAVSPYPLSIIIVGVGNTDFRTMRLLGDGNTSSRDVHTFVEFRRHQHSPNSLITEAAKKFPNQMVEHYVQKRFYPPGFGGDNSRNDSMFSAGSSMSDLSFE